MTTLDMALAYAGNNWPVFPVQPAPSKRPITANGFHDATTGEDQLRAWWAEHPRAQIGVACGEAGLLMVDLDENPSTFTSGRVAIESIGIDPDTGANLVMRTPTRRGLQLVFSCTGIPRMLGVLPGVDILGEGGYSILPSPNSPGREWVSGDPFDPDDLDPLPGWVPGIIGNKRPDQGSSATAVEVAEIAMPQEQALEIAQALEVIPNDDRGTWIRMGMALKSTMAGEQAYALWVEWSQSSPKFDAKDQRYQWDRLHSLRMDGTEITLGTLFHEAKEHGWVSVRYDIPSPAAEANSASELPAAQDQNAAGGESSTPGSEPGGGTFSSGIKLMPFGDVAMMPPIEWQIEGLIPRETVGLLAGDTQAGKSFVAIDLAMRLVHDLPFAGLPVEPCSVLYLAGEGQAGMAARFRAWLKGHEHLGLDQEGRYCLVSSEIPVLNEGSFAVISKLLDELLAKWGHLPRLIIIDTLSQGLDDDENESRVVAPVIRGLMALRAKYGVTILLTHHLVKLQQQGRKKAAEPTLDSVRGSGALSRNIDVVLGLLHLDKEGPRELHSWKQKDGQLLDPIELWMVQMETGRERLAGQVETSCIMIPDSGYKTPLADAPAEGKIEDPEKPNLKAIEALDKAAVKVAATLLSMDAIQGEGNKGALSSNDLVLAMGSKRATVLAAIKVAERNGTITNVGSKASKRWVCVTDVPGTTSGTSGNYLDEN